MTKSFSIRFWIVVLVNILLIPTILLVSWLFYQEFKSSLDERVLLQLTSIKRLKRIQVENWLKREWTNFQSQRETFEEAKFMSASELKDLIGDQIEDGVYDVSATLGEGYLKMLFVEKVTNDQYRVAFEDDKEINIILQERSGMGQTGESYIVGEDYRLRTKSRFMVDTPPLEILCKTNGVLRAFNDEMGRDIIQDYRGVEVYSAFHSIRNSHINWVILSEIDTEEALLPLIVLRQKLVLILLGAFIVAFLLSLVLARVITRPLMRMKHYLDEMSAGNYQFELKENTNGKEIQLMYGALEDMLVKIKSTISFSKEVGEMNLDAKYELIGDNDTLGKSLLAMQAQLRAANEAENNRQKEMRAAIVAGQEKERHRLSKELHDGLGPMLTHLKLLVQSQDLPAEKKQELKSIIDDTVSEVRRMTFNLMPQSLIDFGVAKAIQNLVLMLKPLSTAGIDFIYHQGSNNDIFGDEVNICVFRIAQECLNNGIKHANASEIILVLTDGGDHVNLYYSDDGNGFSESKDAKGGSGLGNMQARAEVLDGKFELNTGEEGTTIEVTIPLART